MGAGGDGAGLLIDLGGVSSGGISGGVSGGIGSGGVSGGGAGGSLTPPLPAVATAPGGRTGPTQSGSLLDIRDIPGGWRLGFL